ncbi:hypothetical protein ABZT43_49030, partial [Streptomyces sp. NPDC005349]|uniref:hypothetical protein n=1 Tax=Streptomyces sp. NPDC005349 TaxID=3157037 RepID=UPI00339EB3A2
MDRGPVRGELFEDLLPALDRVLPLGMVLFGPLVASDQVSSPCSARWVKPPALSPSACRVASTSPTR